MSSVYVTPEDRRHALEEGADAYLTKPVEPGELVAQARALLRIHQAEGRAYAAARHWQSAFEAVNDGVCLLDLEGRVVRCNPALERILHRPSAEILGRTPAELTGDSLPWAACPLARLVQTRSREVADLVLEGRWLRVVADPLLEADGTLSGAVCILSDITEGSLREEGVRREQKMEALTRLAGGVGHDFTNLLSAITRNVSSLLARAPEQGPEREALLAIDEAAWRAVELTSQLVEFSRQATGRLKPTHLPACLDEVVKVLRRSIPSRIVVEMRTDPDLWPVAGNPAQLNQAVGNLSLRACEAMPEGGRLLLEAENVVLDEADAGLLKPFAEGRVRLSGPTRAGEFVRLRVRDTGPGIPPDVLPHLFEPFFTTGEPVPGTGLGLAVVFGIVRQHAGWIEYSGQAPPGLGGRPAREGACFDIYLPRCVEPVESTGPPPTLTESGPPPLLGDKGDVRAGAHFSSPGLPQAEAKPPVDRLEANGRERPPAREPVADAGEGFAPREAPSVGRVRCRRRARLPCPSCGSTCPPYRKRELALLSWVLVALGVLLWPLLGVGLLLRVDVWRCWDCHHVLGRARRPTLGC